MVSEAPLAARNGTAVACRPQRLFHFSFVSRLCVCQNGEGNKTKLARDVAGVGNFLAEKLRTVKGIDKTITCMVFETAKETTEIDLSSSAEKMLLEPTKMNAVR